MNSPEPIQRRFSRLKRQLVCQQKEQRRVERQLKIKSLRLAKLEEQHSLLTNKLNQQIKINLEQGQQSEYQYRQLIDSVQDIIFKISPEGYFTFANSMMENCLGYTQAELIGRHFVHLILPDYRAELIKFYQTMVQTGQSATYIEFPVRAKDGRTVWIGQTVGLVKDDRQVPELVAVARDITQRKLTEDSFQLTQARLESLITNLHTGVLVEDENRKITLTNQLYCDLFSIDQSPDALVGQEFVSVAVPPALLFANAEQFFQGMDEVVANRVAVRDRMINLADGRILEWDYIPIWLAGQYRGHLWKYRDITQKYQTDERIRRSEEKYRSIMNTMELGLLEVDNEQTILRAYDRFCDMMGYTQEELVGQNAADLLVHPEYKPVLNQQQGQRKQGNTGSYEMALMRKDGTRIWVLVSGVPIFDENGALVGSMGIHFDLSERKRLEEELAQARQIAEDARHTEKQFLANMSHEIRTPLNAILGFSNLLEMTVLDSEQTEFTSFIRTAGKNLLNIVNDILDISKIEAGMLPLESIPFSIPSLADSIRTMLHSAATEKNLWLTVETDPTLPAVVLGDPTRLTQILVNLLNNAIKFTQKGGVRVRIEKRAETAESVRIRFIVQDTGIGMAPDILPHIFERFRQASDFTTRYYGGTGLGLNIVKSLAEMQGGWVNVSSTLGEGSCFTLELPYRIAAIPVDLITPGSAIALNPEHSNLRILIVEDNLMNQKLALQVLKRLGYTAQLAENGQLALARLQKEDFDLVLMDIQMPVMDGYTATRHIRTTLKKDVPIIAMTAHALASEREQCLQAGMNDFLPKPFQVEELQRILRKYTPLHYSEGPSSTKPKAVVDVKPSFSLEVLLSALDNDREFAAEVMELFLEQTPGEIQKIQECLEQSDLATIGGIIHTQKVAFKMFGLTEMVRLSQVLGAQIGDGQTVAKVTPLVNQYLQTLEAELPVIQSTFDNM
ncbi:PAS domain S-box protein [Spirosoma sp. HMF4905]|uniref:histidine kinase n=1 Tax=Spirosoma arboris TaxID=2682092 RepID=A0A7K1SNS5_9BACT|nr:PAS domain S-box protein [Spirosoma arboris]MVM35462.1 PAS domain S-box protein [Spirosoma arboris]